MGHFLRISVYIKEMLNQTYYRDSKRAVYANDERVGVHDLAEHVGRAIFYALRFLNYRAV